MESNVDRLIGKIEDYQWQNSSGEAIDNENIGEAIDDIDQTIAQEAITKYVPIGTIVKIYNNDADLMVMGFKSSPNNNEQYDYIGCVFPQGFVGIDQMIFFNHEQIERIYYIGYYNDEQRAYKEELNSLHKK